MHWPARPWGLRFGPDLIAAGATSLPADLPPRLIIPLRRRQGGEARPSVVVGERVLRGQRLAGGSTALDPPLHASTSGWVRAILPLPLVDGGHGPCLLIETDGEDAALPAPIELDHRQATPRAIWQRIERAGLVGLGGAAFPTAAKLAAEPGRIRTLIVNGAECEPGIGSDDCLMRERGAEVIEGAEMLRALLGAERCVLALKEGQTGAHQALSRSLTTERLAALQLRRVPAVYPVGSERQLIQVLTGLELPSGSRPPALGLLCLNVATVAAAYRAVRFGEPLISRLVAVTGSGVRHPLVLDVRLGTPVAELIRQCGGYTEDAGRLILGGPMMGRAIPHDDFPLLAGTHAVYVAARDEVEARRTPRPCIRCGQCAEVCPARLLPQDLYAAVRADRLEPAQRYGLADCIECGCCDLVCPSQIPLTETFRGGKAQAAQRQRQQLRAARARARFQAHQDRLQREREAQQELARRRKETLAQVGGEELARAIERARRKRVGPSPVPGESGSPRTPAEAEEP